MKVVFLDVDGVLNSRRTFFRRYQVFRRTGVWYPELDDEYLGNLAYLVHEKELTIVLSSSWRVYFDKVNNLVIGNCVKGLELLTKLNNFNLTINDMTPRLGNGIRQEEIQEWLINNPVDDFIILDDDIEDLYELQDHLVLTSFKTGFNKNKLKEALELLDKKVLIKKNNDLHNK